jgi:predicted kinase
MKKPVLYLMFGYPGAGKTTVASLIHEVTGAEHLSSDQIRLELFPEPTFSQEEHNKLYTEIDARTKALLAAGKDVIYDANLNRYSHRQEKYAICEAVGAQSKLIWVQTPREVAKLRAQQTDRLHLWPKNETPDAMFERIADVIEEPWESENYVTIAGEGVTQDKVAALLRS